MTAFYRHLMSFFCSHVIQVRSQPGLISSRRYQATLQLQSRWPPYIRASSGLVMRGLSQCCDIDIIVKEIVVDELLARLVSWLEELVINIINDVSHRYSSDSSSTASADEAVALRTFTNYVCYCYSPDLNRIAALP